MSEEPTVGTELHTRRRVDTAFWGLLLTVAIQIFALVWGAASLNNTVSRLADTTTELTQALRSLERAQHETQRRVDVLDAILTERTAIQRRGAEP